MTAWIDDLLDYCERNRLPVDFVSTHIYPTDPLGFEGADTEEQLANSPRDLMRDRPKLVREHARERPVYFTEWNISSNPLYGVPKPVYRAFQLPHGLGSQRLPVAGTHGTVRFHVDLPPHAVAAVTLELAPEPSDGDAAK